MTVDRERERVLILAPLGRDATVATAVLAQAGIESAACADLADLVSALHAPAGAALVTEEALHDPAPLVAWLDAQPAWSDFPFVVLTSSARPRRGGLPGLRILELLRNVTLLERPVQAVTLASAVRAALRARRRQYELQAYLHERERAASALRALNDSLEARVTERTLRLAEANRRLREEIDERRRAEEALRQAQKMQALGQLTGGIAHDFNNVLTAIAGNLELMELQIGDPAALARLIAMAQRGVDRASRLTQQLLAFSRKQHLEPRPTDFNAAVDGMADILRRTCGESIRLETRLGEALWPALTDPHQLETALLNLVINARDAIATRGGVTITTANRAIDATAALDLGLTAGRYVEIAVADDGQGMAPDVAARAFEPFFTTKEVGKGSGLGLSMVYGFVRQSHGHVRIESVEGAGTTVRLLLPAADAAPAPDETVPAVAAPPAGQGADRVKILVVEDATDVREIAVQALTGVGFQVLEAPDASAALEILMQHPDVTLVFTDIVMPGAMNGVDFARTVAERWPGLRLILTSGYAERLVERDWLPPDIAFLRKPYRPVELIGKIRAIVDGDNRVH